LRAIFLDTAASYHQYAPIYRVRTHLEKEVEQLFMEHIAFVNLVMSPQTGRLIILRPDPRPAFPVRPVTVPEGGSTVLFILAALTAMGWAVIRRYRLQTR
jgi:hypothetical protein